MMEYTNFLGENLSEIILGTYGFMEKTDANTAFDIMDFYIENGGNAIDTARSYANGSCEELIARYLKEKKRNIFISTKCAFPKSDGTSRLSPAEIEEDIDSSLMALGVDTIDMLWLHRDDEKKGVRHIIDALNDMVKKGKIRFFGASNWTYERIDDANRYAYESGQDGFCASQVHYNLAKCVSLPDSSLLVLGKEEKKNYEDAGIPIFAYSPQAKGFFQKYATGILSPKAKERYLCEESIKAYTLIKAEADRTGDTLSYTNLKMLINSCSTDVFPIVGVSSIKQLKDVLNVR